MADKIILVNEDKVTRANEILNFVTGRRQPKDEGEAERKVRFTQHLAEAGVDLSDTEAALRFVYEKLGGLVRTEIEQVEFEEKVAPLKKRKGKRE